MHLVQILLPAFGNDGTPMPRERFDRTRQELLDRFGGLTAYTRAPASGLWQEEDGRTMRDDVLVYEVMSEDLDRAWWADYRAALERRFEQIELVVRAQQVERL
ncbi:hypothetical protein [Noviherbaspirillum galbum]|uniref:DUF1330 domain-containing protein n=1 Tax=Noviherbaspirillum galbum TaxID=2709383 RepID=A0A6B3SPE1_9BURK|nr:hypothetical protein [Noviherbaspirillum galbum]NEX61165.1 hypothetical protein [Noviherbaspirillum galbum]